MGAVGEVRHEAPGATSDGGVCERHLKGASVGMQWGGGSGRMHLGRTEKTIQRGGIRRLGRNIYARTHLEKHRHLETTTLEKRFGETSGKSLKRTLKGFALAQDWLSSGSGANRVFGSDSSEDAWGDWDGLPSKSAQLRLESTNLFCILRHNKFLRPHSPSFSQYGDVW